jgi:hypothetical protein
MIRISARKEANVRVLAWEIRKATGLNLGGYNETGGITQTGNISSSVIGGVVIDLPAGTLPATVATAQTILDAHDAALPLPVDFPADPPVTARDWLDEINRAATIDQLKTMLKAYLRLS